VGQPWSFVDMRIYQSALLEDFAGRGGRVEYRPVLAGDVPKLAQEFDLLVVASGRGSLVELFPRLQERSPYQHPQRLLFAAFLRGIADPEPFGMSYNISPGHGEIFNAPFYTFDGRVSNLLFEGIPGQAFEPVVQLRYDDDPKRFENVVLELLREHAPHVFARVNPDEFHITRPLDVLQGSVTPTVRQAYTTLPDGHCVLAIGDVHILNDPVTGQGANAASHAAWMTAEAILGGGPYGEDFCRRVEARIWEHSGPVTEWTNLMLQPPPPHVLGLMGAAAQNQAIADELISNFDDPAQNWAIFGSARGASEFLQRHGITQSIAMA
jgi:hypothetical protein